jgi:hypothetical protein
MNKLIIAFIFLIISFTPSNAEILPHPSGCPARLFCACGAAVEVFGRPIRNLWKASAWFKFPRSAPGYNRVAVRRHHVFVLKEHVRGNVWMVKDYNSGGHKSRYHERSIAGYTIVNPMESKDAKLVTSFWGS